MSKINPKLMPFLVGDLFFTTNNTNPATRFGGTWQLYGKGRTIVGYDPDDTDFDTIGETGGSKKHYHQYGLSTHGWYGTLTEDIKLYNGLTGNFDNIGNTPDSSITTTRADNNVMNNTPGRLEAINNTTQSSSMPPYITTYIWIKTA